MQSLLAKTKTFLTPSGSSANLQDAGKFRTEKRADALFQQTDPAIDGEECMHDCASCTETLPRKWSIDEDDKLYGYVNGWETHLIVGTGKTDWVRDVTDEKGSLMQAVGKLGLDLSNGKLMLSASDMAPSNDHHAHHDSPDAHEHEGSEAYVNGGRTRCIVLPKWEMIENIGVKEAKWLLDEVISKSSTNSTPLPQSQPTNVPEGQEGQPLPRKEPAQFESEETPDLTSLTIKSPTQHPQAVPTPLNITRKALHHRAIILMCSHGTRDWRCGKSAPILKREFERHLRPLGLYRDSSDDRPGGVGIYFINHVGGHKYSANVFVYRRQGRSDSSADNVLSDEAVQGIWLARVRPEDCENIIKFTILQGKLVKPLRQLRGGFDRERGVLSW